MTEKLGPKVWRQPENWQKAILDSADFTIISTDVDGLILTCNAGALQKLGYTEEEVLGKVTPVIIHDLDEVVARAKVLSQELGRTIEPGFEVFVLKARMGLVDENDWTYIRKDGSRFVVRLSVTAVRDAAGNLTGFLGIGKDVTEQSIAQRDLRESQERFRRLSEAAFEGIAVSEQGTVLDCNNQFAAMFGYSPDEIIGQSAVTFIAPESQEDVQEHIASGDEQVYEAIGMRKDGSRLPIEVCGRAAPYQGRSARVTAVRDISERKRAEEEKQRALQALQVSEERLREQQKQLEEANTQLSLLASTDALTGIFNRRSLDTAMRREFDLSTRHHLPLSMLLMDVDKFKDYNDVHGHPAGDAVLQIVALMLKDSARGTDIVARYGGEEFAIVLPATELQSAGVVAERIRVAIASAAWPLRSITVSIGAASLDPAHPLKDVSALTEAADKALYISKREGRNRVTLAE